MLFDPLKTVTYDSKTSEWGYLEHGSKKEKADWLREVGKLPGEYGFDERVKLFYAQADHFREHGYYTDSIEGTFDYTSVRNISRKRSTK